MSDSKDRKNLDALIAFTLGSIFWHLYSSVYRILHPALVLAIHHVRFFQGDVESSKPVMRSTPWCALSHSWYTCVSSLCSSVHNETVMWLTVTSCLGTMRLKTSAGILSILLSRIQWWHRNVGHQFSIGRLYVIRPWLGTGRYGRLLITNGTPPSKWSSFCRAQ
jgi:hypothetical protein